MNKHPFESAPLEVWNAATLGQAALAYASANVAIVPLTPRGKQPLTSHGVHDATTSSHLIREWWARWPQANIGLACQQWWVLDIDPRHGGMTSLQALQEALGAAIFHTRMQLTGGGGVHLLYWARSQEDLRNATRFGGLAGIDLRARGGYIVGAPSVHACGGVYQWRNALPLLPFPEGLARWKSSCQPASLPLREAHPEPLTRGHRHHHEGKAPFCGTPACYLEYAVAQCTATWGRRHSFALYLSYRLIDDLGMEGEDAVGWLCAFADAVREEGDHSFDEEEALDCLHYVIRVRRQAA